MAEESETEEEDEDIYQFFTLPENSAFQIFCTYLIIICCITSSYMYAYLGAFGAKASTPLIEGLSVFFDIVFALDILRKFLSQYSEKGSSLPVKDHTKIRQKYMREDFWSDFVVWLPVYPMIEG